MHIRVTNAGGNCKATPVLNLGSVGAGFRVNNADVCRTSSPTCGSPGSMEARPMENCCMGPYDQPYSEHDNAGLYFRSLRRCSASLDRKGEWMP